METLAIVLSNNNIYKDLTGLIFQHIDAINKSLNFEDIDINDDGDFYEIDITDDCYRYPDYDDEVERYQLMLEELGFGNESDDDEVILDTVDENAFDDYDHDNDYDYTHENDDIHNDVPPADNVNNDESEDDYESDSDEIDISELNS